MTLSVIAALGQDGVMPFAITLCFDSVSAQTVAAMWRTLSEQGIDADRERLGYAPHVTLAIHPDDTPVARLETATETLARDSHALPVTPSGIGVFPGPTSIVFAVPVVTAELLRRHAALHAALSGSRPHAHYEPSHWMPHVTLSGALTDPARALSALVSSWRPIIGMLDRLELVRFRPVEIIRSHALRPLPRSHSLVP
jgi:2'-5' RNA ligase